MKRIGACLIILVAIANSSAGQQLYMEKTFGGARFDTDSLTLSLRQVLEVMADNPYAVTEFKRAKLNYSASGLFGFTGGLLIVVPVITAVEGGSPEWSYAAAGGAMILASIPFTKAFYRHAENALEDYNKKYRVSRVKTNFYFTGTGAKLVVRF
jgi:hypothetical protein